MDIINTPLWQCIKDKLPKEKQLEVFDNLLQLVEDDDVEVDWNQNHIAQAFVWELTPQGHFYWSRLNKKFNI